MLELRAEVLHLQSRTFANLAAAHRTVATQFRELLPELVTEGAARVLAATPISRDTVLRIVAELLREVEPDETGVEVRLSPQDLEQIAANEGEFRERHPTLAFRADADLKPGDCVVRSRFGSLDGRTTVKLHALKEALHAA
jgi:flagellar assembly protein FliH